MSADPPSVEQLFERFRRTGDAVALEQVFDRTAPEILRVAMHLAPDAATAEDLLQSTFLVAIESADRFEPGRRLVPWLCGILARKAHKHRHAEARRPDPEQLGAAAPPADPGRRAADAEFGEAFDRATDNLAQPYRQVVILNLRHGLSPTEIADAIGRSPGTVRSQLARGLEMVRRALPVSFGAGIGAFALCAERGLAAVRAAVLAEAHVHVPILGAASLAGAAAVKKTLALSLGLFVVLAIGALVVPRFVAVGSGPAPAGGASALAARIEPAAAAAAPEHLDPALAAVSERTELPAPADEGGASTGTVLVRLRWASNGAPAEGIACLFHSWEQSDAQLYHERVVSDVRGEVRFEEAYPGRFTVYTFTNVIGGGEVAAGEECVVPIEMPDGIRVRGIVVDGRGAPVPFAGVWLSDGGNDRRDGSVVAHADATGRFELRGADLTGWIGARKNGHAPSAVQALYLLEEGDRPDTREVRLVLPGAAGAVRGRVVDLAGWPVARALVQVGDDNRPVADPPRAYGAPAACVRTGADGTFAVDDVTPGRIVVQARAPGLLPARLEIDVEAGASAEAELALGEGFTLMGTITDPGCDDLRQAAVEVGEHGLFTMSRAPADRAGRYRLRGLPPGEVEVIVHTPGGGYVRAEVRGEPGEVVRFDLVVERGRQIRGRVVDEQGAPLDGFNIWATGALGQRGATRSGADGAFALAGCPDEEHTLEVRAGSEGFTLTPLCVVEGVRPGGPDVEVRVPAASRRKGTISGRLVDARGEPVADATIRAAYRPRGYVPVYGELDPATGVFRIDELTPIRFRVEIEVDGYPTVHLEGCEVAAGGTTDVGVVQLQDGGSVRVELRLADGAEPRGVACAVERAGRSTPLGASGADGAFTSPPVGAGSYTLSVEGDNFVAVRREIVVEAGAELRIEIDLRPAERSRFRFVLPAGARPPSYLHVELRRVAGGVLRRARLAEGEGGGEVEGGELTWSAGLEPGDYEIDVRASTGLAGRTAFSVLGGAVEPPAVVVRLR